MIIELPTKKGNPNTNPQLDFQQLVIVGANGSGKTRLGSNIETKYNKLVHRISAQKSLTFPTVVSPTSKKIAETQFLYGIHVDTWNDETHLNEKTNNRWGRNISTHLLNDFDKLLVLLHTEEYEESLNYKEGRINKPITKLDTVHSIWEQVLPHRKLLKRAGIIETYPTGQAANVYNASQMSDGERVIFYLIGEVVCSPKNSIVIIDEPEMHLHKSLVKKLFDLIENERPDCAFIYLTHDIDFAFTRQNATKIWAKTYEGNNIWDYEILADATPIPEQLYLEILGSRKPVLFLEGDNSSIDYQLYGQVYPNHTIKPLGSCDKVIHSVKSFNEQTAFHQIQSYGIIDRDRRQNDDIDRLNDKNIWVLDVAEAENLLLIEEIVKAVSNHMGKNPVETFNQVKQNLLDFFNIQIESQILLHFKELLKREMIKATYFEEKTVANVMTEINTNFGNIDKQKIFDEIKLEFDGIVQNQDYNAMLRVFNLKNALIPNSKICELTDVKNKFGYLKLVITLLKKNDATSLSISNAIEQRIKKNAI
ncbi:AAA family ATPase [Cellulophaga sp. 20_2_10]|uniref:DUF4435 domain-containing protein n=1 Tax=Cellulophaga sp. 20_2_10 TaxID=2942476 RepID=UPI00201A3CC5|nr:DUF4435 domain-containing protein [Cellulophaga sp. 20_2_10]MCL5244932.1 AAA family ATPase [Cellulophaga sp. 20_2_10]